MKLLIKYGYISFMKQQAWGNLCHLKVPFSTKYQEHLINQQSGKEKLTYLKTSFAKKQCQSSGLLCDQEWATLLTAVYF